MAVMAGTEQAVEHARGDRRQLVFAELPVLFLRMSFGFPTAMEHASDRAPHRPGRLPGLVLRRDSSHGSFRPVPRLFDFNARQTPTLPGQVGTGDPPGRRGGARRGGISLDGLSSRCAAEDADRR